MDHRTFQYTRTCLIVLKEKWPYSDEKNGLYGAVVSAQGGTNLPTMQALKEIKVKLWGNEVAFMNVSAWDMALNEVDKDLKIYKDFMIRWEEGRMTDWVEYSTWNGQLPGNNPSVGHYMHKKPQPDSQKHVYFVKKIVKN